MNYAVIGYPIKHTLSPVIHDANFKALNVESDYMALEVTPEELGDIKALVNEYNLSGSNVTVPHKEKIMQHLDWIAPATEKIGAVNTVHVKDGRYYGYNTDITGYMKAFNDALEQSTAVCLFSVQAVRRRLSIVHMSITVMK